MASHSIDQSLLQAKATLATDIMAGVLTAGAAYIGDKVGLYRAMVDAGPLTSRELADRTSLNERFVREWLYQQAAAGIIEYRGADRFELTDEAALVFADTENPMSRIGGLARFPTHASRFVSAVEAFHTGIGQTYSEALGDAADLPRGPLQVWARTQLVSQVVPRLGDLAQRLEAGGRTADLGCGAGAAPLALARAFPNSRVEGYDNWPAALEICEQLRATEGLSNVEFYNNDEHPLPGDASYDLVMTMDCLHDMTHPQEVARAIRLAMRPDGYWFIVEIDSREDLAANFERPLTRMQYGFSLLVCLQSAASHPEGMALGTLGLPEGRLRELVTEAGFSSLERIPGLEHPINAFYIARP